MAGLAALAFAYVLSQFYRAFLAVLTPLLQADLAVDAADLSRASGAWFVVFALMQFPIGLALDRVGPRRTAGWLMGVCGGGGAALFATASGPLGLVVGMGLIGAGCAPVLMASFYIYARRFPPARFATLSSSLIGVGTLGNIAGAAPMAAAAEAFGWRETMGGLAALSILTGLATLALVADPERERHADDRGLMDFVALLRMPALWPIFPLMFVNYAVVAGVRGLWAGPYLGDVFGMGAAAIGLATLWMAIAMSLGSFAYGPLDRVLGTRKWVIVGGTAAVVVCSALIAFAPGASEARAVGVLVALGFFGVSYAVVMTHARAFFPPRLLGRGVTLLNFFSIGGVGAFQLVTAEIVAAAADPADPAAAYGALFGFYAAATTLSLGAYLFSRDARP